MPRLPKSCKSRSGKRWPAMSKVKFNKLSQATKFKQQTLNYLTPTSSQTSQSSLKSRKSPMIKRSQSPFRAFKVLADAASNLLEAESNATQAKSPRRSPRKPPHTIALMTPSANAPQLCAPRHSPRKAPLSTAPLSQLPSPPTSFDFKNILNQLGKVAVSSNLNDNFKNDAKIILKDFKVNPLTFEHNHPIDLYQLRDDNDAQKVLTKCQTPYNRWRPLYTLPDGNCVFNTIVLFLRSCPSPEMVLQLRIAVVAELVFNGDSYHTVLQKYCKTSDRDFIDQEIMSEARSACKQNGWCGYVSFAALSTILLHPIRLVHPIYSVPTDSGFAYNPHAMNDVLIPIRGEGSLETITVLACGNSDQLFACPANWRSNHFVLLIDPFIAPTNSPMSSAIPSATEIQCLNSPAPIDANNISSDGDLSAPQSISIEIPAIQAFQLFDSSSLSSDARSSSNLLCKPSPAHYPNSAFSGNLNESESLAYSSVCRNLQFNTFSVLNYKSGYLLCSIDSAPSATFWPPAASPPTASKTSPSSKSEASAAEPLRALHQNLLPGAFLLEGNRFMSTQAIFDLFSCPDVADRSIERLPKGHKSNCFFILNLGKDLTEYGTASSYRLKIQDRLRDGTGAWDNQNLNNSLFHC